MVEINAVEEQMSDDPKRDDRDSDPDSDMIEVTLRDFADALDVGAASRTVRRLRKYAPELADRLTETASAVRDADGAIEHFKEALKVADRFSEATEEEHEELVTAATAHLKAAWAHASAAKKKLEHVGQKLDEWRGSPVFGFSRFARKADGETS